MDPFAIFAVQLSWFAAAWSVLVYFAVWPWSRRLSQRARLSLWVAPQMFRVLGLGLLVPSLAPGMPRDFAVATALGDSLTASLALLAFVSLRRGWRAAHALTWACTLVGVTDLLIAFPHAARSGAIAHLAAQWYVPVLGGPLMVVAHVACLVELLHGRRASAAA